MDDNLRQTFFPDVKNDEKKIVAAFCKMSADNALKTKPKVAFEWSSLGMTLLIEIGIRCRSQRYCLVEASELRSAEKHLRRRDHK
jgi:hypothetical protein